MKVGCVKAVAFAEDRGDPGEPGARVNATVFYLLSDIGKRHNTQRLPTWFVVWRSGSAEGCDDKVYQHTMTDCGSRVRTVIFRQHVSCFCDKTSRAQHYERIRRGQQSTSRTPSLWLPLASPPQQSPDRSRLSLTLSLSLSPITIAPRGARAHRARRHRSQAPPAA